MDVQQAAPKRLWRYITFQPDGTTKIACFCQKWDTVDPTLGDALRELAHHLDEMHPQW